MVATLNRAQQWPRLDYESWKDTCASVHLWTQMAGKIRMARTPWTNHSWHVALYVSPRGLCTSPIAAGARTFQIDFDFVEHLLSITTSEGQARKMPLQPRSVADFYQQLCGHLAALGLETKIHTLPNEVVDAIAFEQDQQHRAYDAPAAHTWWRALAQADRVFKQFRAGFIGKCSPVHFFWGSFDLAVTRFSGRPAPMHPGGVPNCPDWVTREAYSHEVSSCGFWPGGAQLPYPLFYCYAYPEVPGFAGMPVGPPGARYDGAFHEFVLPYDVVQRSNWPDATLLEFLHGSYAAAANLAGWDRHALERKAPAQAAQFQCHGTAPV